MQKSTTGEEQAYLIWFSLGLMMIVLAVVFILFARFVIKYRYKKEKDDFLPEDVKGNLKLELTWTILPIILLIVLAVPTIQITYDQSPQTSADADAGMDIGVAAEQFKWTFSQPNGKTEENKLVLPEGETVTLHLSSKDVIHSFWVPALAGKIDTIPGKQVTYEIKNPKKGDI
ncbi:cytochrome c oxidase subunit II [Virgibacillus halophilus]|uniref:Cytochrome c oxidase subunit 2 n=1 Tax=Tigheibacillus halophilus TaxID=361280 RepID=A0ABU5C4M3_9BACI|nr:cytochrome c oxidase subunit II [Virgibacillus halophilus]